MSTIEAQNSLLSTVRYACFFRGVLFFALISVLGACSVTNRTTYEDDEGAVPESFFSSIKKNKTQKPWLVYHLGEPLSAYHTTDDKEIVTYQIKRAKYRHASLLFLLRYNSVKRDPRYFHVLLNDDVVKKTWWDEHSIPQWKLDQSRPAGYNPDMSKKDSPNFEKSIESMPAKKEVSQFH